MISISFVGSKLLDLAWIKASDGHSACENSNNDFAVS